MERTVHTHTHTHIARWRKWKRTENSLIDHAADVVVLEE